MRRAIADSDDEEDDLAIEARDCDIGAVLPEGGGTTDAEVADESLDSTNEKSTGSTEHLRRQVQSAERRLVSNSAPKAMDGQAHISSASPSIQANKRRHTSVLGSETNGSTQRSVKRSKTVKTYGSRCQTHVKDDCSFECLREDDAAPKTSQSAKFTEHSGLNSSAALPSGSIQEDFLSHEPNMMFPDSGSTIADNSSAQRRLLEQALGRKPGLTTSVGVDLKSDEQQDSSIPWSTSDQKDTTKSSSRQEPAHIQTADENAAGVDAATGDRGSFRLSNALAGVRRSSDHPKDERPDKTPSEPPQADLRSNITLSPAVEIRQDKSDAFTPVPEASTSTQKARRGCKRKAQEDQDADLVISDDRPIDLPKEQYKPRPSRRRATQIVEEPIDFSVRPEKAAKVKRTKTTHAGEGSATLEAGPGELIATSVTVSSIKTATHPRKGGVESDVETPSIESQMVRKCAQDITETTDNGKEQMEQKTPQERMAPQAIAERNGDDEIVMKPPKSTQKRKSTSKTKRSHTTIFEDHVEFAGSQRAPNLSQQQANRKSALQAVQNEAKTSQRKRRTVVTNDEDEDELVKEGDEEQEEHSAPKKRGRGRPPKSTAKVQPEAFDKALEDSKGNEGNQPESGGAPKKAESGRSSKACDASEATAKSDSDGNEPSNSQPSNEALENRAADAEINESGNASDPSDANLTSTKLPTPSPEKQHTPQKDMKPSPTSQSPIKSTSNVPFRVGLSKRHRIPPLLRVVKPPKR